MFVLNKLFLVMGSLSAFIAVALGAVGAHFLKTRLSVEMLNIFEVGVRYHLYHSLGILIAGLLLGFASNFFIQSAAWAFTIGTIIFSGSLYLLAVTGVCSLGAITPIGGLFLLIGWLALAYGIWVA